VLSSRALQDFEGAYARFFAPIKAKSLRLLASSQAADDVTQEVFLRFWQWRSRPSLDTPEATRTILAWLYRTCTRLSIDALRERAPRDAAVACPQPCSVDVDGAIAAKTAIASLRGAALRDELEAAVLCRVDGLSQPEASLVLGISERTVRRLLTRFDERTQSVRREFAP
jgi:RNA polymerase sigma-70 factor, ECF subfamily